MPGDMLSQDWESVPAHTSDMLPLLQQQEAFSCGAKLTVNISTSASVYLHGILVLPRLLPSAQLPQDDTKRVDVTLLIVSLTAQNLRSRPFRCACLRFGAQPGAAPHP